MNKKVFVLWFVVVAFLMVAISTLLAIQLDNASNKLSELKEEYGNLSAEYNETSGELNETNEWLEENKIREEGDWIKVGNITVLRNGEYAMVNQFINKDTWLELGIGVSHGEAYIMIVNNTNKTWTEYWNCTGEKCRLPILQDIEDDGEWYKWKGIWLRKDNNFASAIQKIDDTIIQGIMRINDKGELTIKLVTTNDTDPYNEQWNCSDADCLNMT